MHHQKQALFQDSGYGCIAALWLRTRVGKSLLIRRLQSAKGSMPTLGVIGEEAHQYQVDNG